MMWHNSVFIQDTTYHILLEFKHLIATYNIDNVDNIDNIDHPDIEKFSIPPMIDNDEMGSVVIVVEDDGKQSISQHSNEDDDRQDPSL